MRQCANPRLVEFAGIGYHLRVSATSPLRRSIPLILCALLFASAASAQTQSEPPLPVFEFHSGFWINLHHFLYQQARLHSQRTKPAGKAGAPARAEQVPELTQAEQSAWESVRAYYAAQMIGRDLLFNRDMVLIKDRLAELEADPDLSKSGLQPALVSALELAAPVYRAHWWPAHDKQNREWIADVAPLIRQKGRRLAEGLSEIYRTEWPAGRIRVDVAHDADSAGAYTTLAPLRVTISSNDPDIQGRGAFEMLFYEASHAVAGGVSEAIARECRRLGKPIPRELWQALLFYTTGEVVRRALIEPAGKPADGGSSYTPYAYRVGLYGRGWQNYQRLLEHYWQPYLDRRTNFDDALARLVSAL